ncbi:KRAB [Mytilus edulis]|uniref:KRAB n=1 Tax=Mytilus edulis TaxID=6550 RepID=A0A8S3QI85_MYTED|nr:KRAB [Mytilus edulis]
MKVHLPSYMADNPDKSSTETEIDDYTGDEKDSDISDIHCEKCPYASAKRSHYERHVEIHGSKQRHMCKYCDYSVPSRNLLVQHERLHCTQIRTFLAIQSLSNLMQLPEVPADVALASALPPIDTKESFKVSVTHDHIELYENSNQFDIEPRKFYRCDRCPYANVRRDHLLTHLKFHMLKSTLACPYCDYSVSKTHHLSQHIRVHFCPLPELSNWLAENGQLDRVKQNKDPDISEALYVAQLYKRDGQKQSEENEEEQCNGENEEEKGEVKMEEESCDSPAQKEMNGVEIGDEDMTPVKENKQINEASKSSESDTDNEISFKDSSIIISPTIAKDNSEEPASEKDVKMEEEKTDSENGEKSDVYICQYCDRELDQSDLLVQHEMQHLIGNNYEVYLNQVSFLKINGYVFQRGLIEKEYHHEFLNRKASSSFK